MLEHIIVDRLIQHLREVGPDLNESQYSFREGRSIVDAILQLWSFAERHSVEGGVT
ncbi:hypothetical protein ACFW04_011345 [Cataglyphis niger]